MKQEEKAKTEKKSIAENAKLKDEFDIRLKNPSPEDYYQAGKEAVRRQRANNVIVPQIVTGGDCRQDTEVLLEAFEKGIREEGGAVLSLGKDIAKPIVFYASEFFQADGLGYVTASHVNVEYNGLKMNTLHNKPFMQLAPGTKAEIADKVTDAYLIYIKSIFGNIGKGKQITIDCLYGTSTGIAQKVFENAGFRVASVHDYIDGTFSRLHDNAPDPHLNENLEELAGAAARFYGIGVAFDGDVDRVGIVDEYGKRVGEDEITMLIAKHLIPKAGKKPRVVYEIKSSNAVKEVIETAGGEAVMEKTGWQNIKKRMREVKAIFAGELSGHNFYGKQFYYVPNGDDGIFTAMMISQIMAETGKPLMELRKDLPKYAITHEMRIEYDEKRNPEIVRGLVDSFKAGAGERAEYKVIEFDDDKRIEAYDKEGWKGWAVVRSSKTETQKLTVRFEGRDDICLSHMVKDFTSRIPKEDAALKETIEQKYEKDRKDYR